ncbi:MAG: hypothetical protein R3D43_03230 [Tepidamorphaceae bacterium]
MIFRGEGVKQDEALAADPVERAARGGNAAWPGRVLPNFMPPVAAWKYSVSAAFWYLMARQRSLTDPSLEALVHL